MTRSRLDSPVIVTSFAGLSRASRWTSDGCRWLYLGKDIRQREQVESVLGADNRWQLGEQLHQAASELRQPFLDFVSEVGRHQTNQISWWSSSFSWKVWGASDLFLLVCYLGLANRVIGEAADRGAPLLLVIEDPWLLRQLSENYSSKEVTLLDNGSPVGFIKLNAVFQGLVKRAAWLVRTVRNYWKQRRAWEGETPRGPEAASAAIYSFPMARCLRENAGWADPFLSQMDIFLRDWGYPVVRFSPPEASGLEREIAERRQYFQPLILFATLGAVWRSLTAFWQPRWPQPLTLSGMPVNRLAEREWWLDLSRSSWCVYGLFYECLQRMLGSGKWRWIVYPYENQPWEKMIAVCARERGIGTVAIQHSTISVYYMSYFLGKGEADHMPLPDVILTSGPYPHHLMGEGGHPSDRLKMCGSIRYNHLTGAGNSGQPLAPAPRNEILVALPIDIHMSRHLLAAIRRAFPDGGREEGLTFHIKAHPSCPISDADVGFSAQEAPASIDDALKLCGLVIFIGSTVGPEAVALGRTVLRYRPELLLDVDTSESFADRIPTCNDTSLREVVLKLTSAEPGVIPPETVQELTSQVFAPLNLELLEEVFRGRVAAGAMSARDP